MPPDAVNGHIGLMPGDSLKLHNSDELMSALKQKSIIRTTQEDNKKFLTLLVMWSRSSRSSTSSSNSLLKCVDINMSVH